MSVWCVVKGDVRHPYKDVSIRRLVNEMFDECSGVAFNYGVWVDTFEFAFCDDGISAAKAVEAFCSVLRARRIRADIIAEVRFVT